MVWRRRNQTNEQIDIVIDDDIVLFDEPPRVIRYPRFMPPKPMLWFLENSSFFQNKVSERIDKIPMTECK